MARDTLDQFPDVDRVEVIDGTGRAYMNYAATDVQIAFQDDRKTLKIFLRSKD